MVPRKRSPARRDWPANLYPCKAGFKYRHPVTRKDSWMGTDQAKAFAAARKLNALLVPTDDLVARVVAQGETVADAIRVFRDEVIPGRGWGERTAAEYGIIVRRIERGLGDRPVATLSVKDCAEWLRNDTESARGRQTRRQVLIWILACAVHEGWIDTNPAEATRKAQHERQRDRMTLDAYRAIHAQAEPWLRNAMDLSLLTLLRRDDVVSVRFADARDGALWIVPAKTEDSTLVKLRIAMTPALESLAARCRDSVVSPFLIHRLPEKARPQDKRAAGRHHHTQVMPEQLTRAFKEARDQAGITGPTAPTFHEIRSLGGALLRTQAGWSQEQVQALMGHASATMTRHYLEGHDAPWQEVSPGLALPG